MGRRHSRAPRSKEAPSLEAIVANPEAPKNRSDALLHDADKKPNLSGYNSPRHGRGPEIAAFVLEELEGWKEGHHLTTNKELAEMYPGGSDTAIINILNHHLYREHPEIKTARNRLLGLQEAQRLHDRPDHVKSMHSQKGYASSLGLFTDAERIRIGRRGHNAGTHKPRVGGLRFDSAEEFAVGQVLKAYIPGFSMTIGDTYQVPIGEKSLDYLVTANDLAVFVEWHPIALGEPGKQRSGFTSMAQYRRYLRAKQNTTHGRTRLANAWRARLLTRYVRERAALIDSSTYEGTPLIVAFQSKHLSQLFPLLDLPVPPQHKLFDLFHEARDAYGHHGSGYLNRRYSP